MATDIKPIAEDEYSVANEGAAPYSNRFFTQVGPVVRITFAEQDAKGKNLQFRTAVALSHQHAIELKDILGGLLSDIEKQIEAAKASATAKNLLQEAAAGAPVVKRRI